MSIFFRTTGLILSIVMLFLALGSAPVAASSTNNYLIACQNGEVAANTEVCQDVNTQASSGGNVVIGLVKDAINILSFIVGVAAVIIIVISGIRFATSGGDANAIAGAKKGLFGALMGIVIVALAQTIVIFILDRYN